MRVLNWPGFSRLFLFVVVICFGAVRKERVGFMCCISGIAASFGCAGELDAALAS